MKRGVCFFGVFFALLFVCWFGVFPCVSAPRLSVFVGCGFIIIRDGGFAVWMITHMVIGACRAMLVL